MRGGVSPGGEEAGVLAVSVLDEFVAEIVRQARAQGVTVPSGFFDWAAGDATLLVDRLVQRRGPTVVAGAAAPRELRTALRCAVRHWVAPWIVARFAPLRPLFPELSVHAQGREITVLVRGGRWRCAGPCSWKLCEAPAAPAAQ